MFLHLIPIYHVGVVADSPEFDGGSRGQHDLRGESNVRAMGGPFVYELQANLTEENMANCFRCGADCTFRLDISLM